MSNPNTTELDLLKSLTTSGGATDTLHVIVDSSALPSGSATAANQVVGNTNLASIDGKITTVNTGAVTISTALPTGTNSIGQVTANAGTNLNTSLLALDSTVAKDASLSTINTSVNTLLKPSNTLAAVTTLGTITNALPACANSIGQVTANAGTNLNTSALALSATHTNGTQKSQTVDVSGNIQPSGDTIGRAVFVNAVSVDSIVTTYSATDTFTAASTATDIFTITGSATKTIRVLRLGISATQTTASPINLSLVKRSTGNSGGTSTTLTNVPLDSNDAAASAVVRSYTANPTLGTSVGNIKNLKFTVSASNANGSPQIQVILVFGERTGHTIVLRGTSEILAFNLNSTTLTGNSFSIWAEWTEE